jgi:hypothetical protein
MTKPADLHRLLELAGKMAEAARAVVGGHALGFSVSPSTVHTITANCEHLRKAVDAYDRAIMELAEAEREVEKSPPSRRKKARP